MLKTKVKRWFSKNYSWVLLNSPAFLMLVMVLYQPSLWGTLTPYTGYTALILLIIVLALNPLQALIPTSIFIKKINRFRRQIGVAVFSYATVHFICFFTKRDYSVSETLLFFLHPAIFPAVIALTIFSLLALTSNNYSVKKMGFMRWKKLHRLIYIAEVFVFIHMILVGATFYALLAFIPLFIFQFLRKKRNYKKVT